MAITLTHVGSVTSTTFAFGNTLTIAGAIPAGALIVVAANIVRQAGGLAASGANVVVGDDAGNSYIGAETHAALGAPGLGQLAYCGNSNAATLITLTNNFSAGVSCGIAASVFYATGIEASADPLDLPSIGRAQGFGSAPSVALAALPARGGSLILGLIGSNGPVSDGFTQDAVSAAYTTPPNRAGDPGSATTKSSTIAGGSVVSSLQLAYAPALGTARGWNATIAAFRPRTAPILRFGGTVRGADDFDIIDVRFLPTNDPDKGVRAWQMQLGYGRNYTVQPGDGIDAAATQAHRVFVASELRHVSSSDASVKTANPLAMIKQIDTLIVGQADAQAESDRRLGLYKVRRDFIELDTPMTQAAIQTLDIGNTATVVLNRFGYDAGRKMVITGMLYNAGKNILTLALWG